MLSQEDLEEMAADIKERGQLQPIVIDQDGAILDGRNRYAACMIAGVEPSFETYDGDDPAGYALAVNVNRRHLRPGQRYLITEKARRLSEKSRKSYISGTATERVSLSEAAVVLDFAPDMGELVMNGTTSLASAAEEARKRKKAKQDAEERLRQVKAKAPDLAALVDEGDLELDDAVAAMNQREVKARAEAEETERRARAEASEQQRRDREAEEAERLDARRANTRLADAVTAVLSLDDPRAIERAAFRWDPLNCESPPQDVKPEKLKRAAATLIALAEEIKR